MKTEMRTQKWKKILLNHVCFSPISIDKKILVTQ
jgi:hypothetical protein